jgi:hypothetical protein
MRDQAIRLGGRLPLLDPKTLAAAQKHLYDRIEATMVPWSERVGFQGRTADGRLIGPFNPGLFSPEIANAFLALQLVEEKKHGFERTGPAGRHPEHRLCMEGFIRTLRPCGGGANGRAIGGYHWRLGCRRARH